MRTLHLITLALLLTLAAFPVSAQDDCTPAAIVATLADTDDLDSLRDALMTALQQVNACTTTETGTARQQPVPLGDSFQFSEGTLTITEAQVVTLDSYGADFLQISLQWHCQQADDNDTCNGNTLVRFADFVSADGNVVQRIGVYPATYIGNMEAYTGATIAGVLYFEQAETRGALLRLQVDDQTLFFALE